jgi:hypothetical protein
MRSEVLVAALCACVALGCGGDGNGNDAGTSVEDTLSAQCTGEVTTCCVCDTDVETDAVCKDGAWVCESDPDGFLCGTQGCDVSDCSLYNGEVCCTSEGPISAKCPTPSQAYCEDGSEPKMSCDP